MDKFDRQIISCLRDNARVSTTAIATEIGLSRSAVTERIRKLEDSGVIKGYQVVLEPAESYVSAYFLLSFDSPCCDEIAPMLKKFDEVQSIDSISGDIDMVVWVRAASMGRLNEVRSYMETLPQVEKILTCTVLKEQYRAAT